MSQPKSIPNLCSNRTKINNNKSFKNHTVQKNMKVLFLCTIVLVLIGLNQWNDIIWMVNGESYYPVSLQSGKDLDGSTFVADVAYNINQNQIVITGSTFGNYFANTNTDNTVSTCFIATVNLPSYKFNTMKWNNRQTLGHSDVMESCSQVMYHRRYEKLIVSGYSEIGGFLDKLYDDGTLVQATQYGFLLDVDARIVSTSSVDTYIVNGGRILQEAKVTYPVAVATSIMDEYIYVASQETDNTQRNEFSAVSGSSNNSFNISDETDPMRFFNYGKNYYMSIGRFKLLDTGDATTTIEDTFSQGWKKSFATNDNAAVHIAGMVKFEKYLVIAGTTDGVGDAFGNPDDVAAAGTMDGFITLLNVDDGSPTQLNGQRAAKRIESTDGADDWIAGICFNEPDTSHVYLVGATEGNLPGSNTASIDSKNIKAFAMKVNILTMEIVWTTTFEAESGSSTSTGDITQVRGISCAVASTGTAVWVGGVVQDGAVLPDSGTVESYGYDDIFVAKLDPSDGTKIFVKQLGSEEDDGMAMRGGLVVDSTGNCIVIGNTYGSFYRERDSDEDESGEWISDVYITTIRSEDGAISYPIYHSNYLDDGADSYGMAVNDWGEDGGPTLTPGGDGGSDAGYDDDASAIGGNNDDIEPTTSSSNSTVASTKPIKEKSTSSSGMDKNTMTAVILLCVVGAVLFVFAAARRQLSNRDVTTSRSHVVEYLSDFDVSDIDLKHSATGGWHCSYSNDLARGVNRRSNTYSNNNSPYGGLVAPSASSSSSISSRTGVGLGGSDPLLMTPLTNSSVLEDSLFMSGDDDQSIGSSSNRGGLYGGNRFSESSGTGRQQRQGYDGLIDNYMAAWEDDNARTRSTQSSSSSSATSSDRPSGWGKDIL